MKEARELNTKDVAGNIKKVRKIKSLTQDYLATKLNISQNAYSKIELGHSKLTVERLFQISAILDVQIMQLLNFKPSDFAQSSRKAG